MNTRSPESDHYYERDNSREIAECKAALSKMPNFIEEAIANADPDKLIAAYLRGENSNLLLGGMISAWADHCIARALRPGNGPTNIGDSLQNLLDSFS